MARSAYLMIVEAGTQGVVVMLDDGVPSLPRVDDWDGESSSLGLRFAGRDLQGTVGGAWHPDLPPLTILASLAGRYLADEEQLGDMLYLCEPALGHTLAGRRLRWWQPDADSIGGLPADFDAAMRTAYSVLFGEGAGIEEGVRWPPSCRPGFTRALAEALAADPGVPPHASLPGTGHSRPTELVQLQGWCLSSVWWNDEVVLKVTNPNWPREPDVNRLLHRLAPHVVEPVLASGRVAVAGADPAPWLLQRRAARALAGGDADADEGEVTGECAVAPAHDAATRTQHLRLRAVEVLAELQLSTLGHSEALRAAGVADRSIERIARSLEFLWAAPELRASLEPSELEALPALDTWLRSRLSDLAGSAPSPLLTHGDLHLGNVVETPDGSLRFIDWTDAALSWPGVDLRALLPPASMVEEREAVIAAYERAIGPDHAPAVRTGAEIAALFYAISYTEIDAFLPASARWHFRGTTTHMVRYLLKLVQ